MEGNRDSDPPRFVYVSRLRTRGNLTDPDAEGAAWKRRQPPLLHAARENRPDVIKRLIEEGTSVNVKDSCGMTALHMAVLYGYPGAQFNRNIGFRDKFKDNIRDDFSTWEVQVKTCYKTPNMIRDGLRDGGSKGNFKVSDFARGLV